MTESTERQSGTPASQGNAGRVAILSREQIEALRALDSPTVANAIERFIVRPRCEGYAGYDLRCAFPRQGTMMGYAVTCTADSTTEGERPRGLLPLWDALEAAPKPAVLVIKDVGQDVRRSCHMGEVMATVAKALGAVGCVSDGGLRDVLEVEALGGFQYFCPGFVVSHGNPIICDVGAPVTVSGLRVESGDLLHGDVNGLLVLPSSVAARVADEAMRVRDEERVILDLARQPGFSVAKLREAIARFTH
ncbi:MAG: RraA family protein [Vicinamibacteraceae bacterium]